MEFSITPILNVLGYGIYISLALVALYGAFLVVLLLRRTSQKRFPSQSSAGEFLDELRQLLQSSQFEAAAALCDSPRYWSRATCQLALVALANRQRTGQTLRRILAEKFEHDVLADLEYRMSWINTIVKSAPMLGLLGTVVGMINAFGKIAAMQQSGGDPSQLAGEISFALFTTAAGLTVAIPLVLAGAAIQVRIGKLQDSVQAQLGVVLDELEPSVARGA
mgnify:FL=1